MAVDEDMLAAVKRLSAEPSEEYSEADVIATKALSEQYDQAAKDSVERCLTVALQSAECVATGRDEDASILSTYLWDQLSATEPTSLIYFGYWAMIALVGEFASNNGRTDLLDTRNDEVAILNKLFEESE